MKTKMLILAMLAFISAWSAILNRAEYFIDTDPGLGNGIEIPISADSLIDVSWTIDTDVMNYGPHIAYFRVRDNNGNWSFRHAKDIFKFDAYAEIPPDPEASLLVKLEYFVDVDPGFDNGTAVVFTPSLTIDTSFIIDTSSLSDGPHKVYYRFKDSRGHWSFRQSKDIFKFVTYNPIPADAEQSPIVKCEYFIDTDPGFGLGMNVPVTADSIVEVNFIVETSGLSEGAHRVYYRFQDATGRWSYRHNKDIFKYAAYATIPPDPEASPLVKLEYFVDVDPGFDNGTAVVFTPSLTIDTSFIIDTSSLSNGPHKVYYRFKDSRGHWSFRQSKDIFKFVAYNPIPADAEQSPIVKCEYFIDTDPGFGLGMNVPVTADSVVEVNFIVVTTGLSEGAHRVYYRFQDASGRWSYRHNNDIFKYAAYVAIPPDPEASPLVKLEYFVDVDPGFDNGTAVVFTPSLTIDTSFIIDTSSLSNGPHKVYYRFKDSRGHWSFRQSKDIFKFVAYDSVPADAEQSPIVKCEYFIDTDPGFGLGMNVPVTADSVVEVNFIVDTSPLTFGPHTVYYRFQNQAMNWSKRHSKPIFKFDIYASIPADTISMEITSVKWYITGENSFQTDVYSYSDFNSEYTIEPFIAFSVMDLQLLVPYTLHLYVVDSNGHKSQTIFTDFIIDRRPQVFQLEADSNLMHIIWNPVPGATGYKVYTSPNPYGEYSETNEGTINGNVWTFENNYLEKFFKVTSLKEDISK